MRRLRAGPDRDAAIQRLRAQWAADEVALRTAPFPILGLAPPFPSPVGLGSFEAINGQVSSVGLRYGGSDPSSGPLVTVCTTLASADRGSRPSIDLLQDLLQDLLGEHEDTEQSQPPSGRDAEAAEVIVDGVPVTASTMVSGQAWGAVAEPVVDAVALLVTVAGRDWPLPGLALTRVQDLGPFLAGRRERVEAALSRAGSQPGPESWDLPAADGVTGHRALADMMITTTRERMAAGRPLQPSPLPGDYAQRWEIATRAQMALAGQNRDDAEDAIHSMINHLCQLAQSESWFANSELADKAIAETLEYAAHGRVVPSAEAQRTWSRYWSLHGQQPPAFESLSAAKESWLAAWQHWVEHR